MQQLLEINVQNQGLLNINLDHVLWSKIESQNEIKVKMTDGTLFTISRTPLVDKYLLANVKEKSLPAGNFSESQRWKR